MNVIITTSHERTQDLIKIACREGQHHCDFIPKQELSDPLSQTYQICFLEIDSDPIKTVELIKKTQNHHPDIKWVLITQDSLNSQNIEKLGDLSIFGYLHTPPTLSDIQGLLSKISNR